MRELPITTRIISHQTYGDMIRFNPHWHCIILEGGVTDNNEFYHIPIINTVNLTEVFRKSMIKLFVDKKLINKDFAILFSNWKNSGFSVDNSVFLSPYDDKAREGLCQYIARLPVSLQKITYEPVKKKIIYHTKYNEYWGENMKLFTATDFIADLTVHIPPKGKKEEIAEDPENKEVPDEASKKAWARLIKKVYEVDPLICPKCGSEMKIVAMQFIAIVQDRDEIEKIIACALRKRIKSRLF